MGKGFSKKQKQLLRNAKGARRSTSPPTTGRATAPRDPTSPTKGPPKLAPPQEVGMTRTEAAVEAEEDEEAVVDVAVAGQYPISPLSLKDVIPPLISPLNLVHTNVIANVSHACIHPTIAQLPFSPTLTPDSPIGGRVRHYAHNWQVITQDRQILQMVTGLKVDWQTRPSCSYQCREPKFNADQTLALDQEVTNLLTKGAIERTTESHPQFVGHLFLRPKKDGGKRPIYNMRPLNHYVQYQHFKMDNLSMVKTVIRPYDYMVKVDLKDAYQCIPVHQKDRRFMRLKWKGTLYQFTCLPFGLASAPRQFTRLMKPIVTELRKLGVRLLIYLDDILLFNQDPSRLVTDTNSLTHLLSNLGLVLNTKKSVTIPTREIEFLGMEIDSVKMNIALPQDKLDNIRNQCESLLEAKSTTVHRMSQLIGTLTSTLQAVQPAPLYYRALQMTKTKELLKNKSYAATMMLTDQCKLELQWWVQNLVTWNGRAIISSGPDMIIQTDASKAGWGAHREGRPLSEGVNGLWSVHEQTSQINLLELRAAEFAIKALAKGMTNIHIHLKMDNIVALTYINKLGGTRSDQMVEATRSLWQHCLQHRIHVTAEYLPGVQNQIADKLSRQYDDWSNWRLDTRMFQKLNAEWGPLTTDLFADRLNAQTKTFYSWKPDPAAAGTNAFLTIWGKESYAFPPFCLIGSCLAKVLKDQTDLVLIAPKWPGQHWYPMLLNMLTRVPILLPQTATLLTSPAGQPHPLLINRRLMLAAWHVSGRTNKTRAFRQSLQNSSPNVGVEVQEMHTMPAGMYGPIGVVNGITIPCRHL